MRDSGGGLGKFVLVVVVLAGIGFSAFLVAWRGVALHELFYGYQPLQEFFQNEVNLPKNWSAVLATVLWALWVVVCVLIPDFSLRLFVRKADVRWAIATFLGLCIYYIPMPLARAILASDVCMRQDGTTDKWFVETAEGRILLFDNGGFDRAGNEKKKASPEICRQYALQHQSSEPKHVTYNPDFRFFSGNGFALAWYYRAPNKEIELFDAPGFHPVTGEQLHPITRDIVFEYQAQERRRAEAAAKRAKAEAARRQAEEKATEDAQRRAAAEEEARQRQAELDASAAADAEKRAEVDKKRVATEMLIRTVTLSMNACDEEAKLLPEQFLLWVLPLSAASGDTHLIDSAPIVAGTTALLLSEQAIDGLKSGALAMFPGQYSIGLFDYENHRLVHFSSNPHTGIGKFSVRRENFTASYKFGLTTGGGDVRNATWSNRPIDAALGSCLWIYALISE